MITKRRLLDFLDRRWWTIRSQLRLWGMRGRSRFLPRHRPGRARFEGFEVRFVDFLSFYMEYKDIFARRIYHFTARTPAPLILDGGGCIGMSVLYFKRVYPQARIVCFEPDEKLFQVLRQNVTANGLTNVDLVRAGLAGQVGTARFQPDGADGGRMADEAEDTIPTVRLSDYITSEIDFLKLNIEGQELLVLEEVAASGKLRNAREMVLEYHGWGAGEQRLGAILTLLDRHGFRFLVHDFDDESCPTSKPPFVVEPKRTWFCLVYAKRVDPEN
jgi:FkbM family methyltransferase